MAGVKKSRTVRARFVVSIITSDERPFPVHQGPLLVHRRHESGVAFRKNLFHDLMQRFLHFEVYNSDDS
jgi:hypothetical protein